MVDVIKMIRGILMSYHAFYNVYPAPIEDEVAGRLPESFTNDIGDIISSPYFHLFHGILIARFCSANPASTHAVFLV